MSYSVYFKYDGTKYKLPVNPESIQKSRSINTNTYTILGGNEVILPSSTGLYTIKFSFELPSYEHHYVESESFEDADYYEKMFKDAQQNKSILRFIASNEINEDISMDVLVTSLTITEEAGQEGDKQVDIELTEYREPTKIYKAVEVKKEEKNIRLQEEGQKQEQETKQETSKQVQRGKKSQESSKKSNTKEKQPVMYKPKLIHRLIGTNASPEVEDVYSKAMEYIAKQRKQKLDNTFKQQNLAMPSNATRASVEKTVKPQKVAPKSSSITSGGYSPKRGVDW